MYIFLFGVNLEENNINLGLDDIEIQNINYNQENNSKFLNIKIYSIIQVILNK